MLRRQRCSRSRSSASDRSKRSARREIVWRPAGALAASTSDNIPTSGTVVPQDLSTSTRAGDKVIESSLDTGFEGSDAVMRRVEGIRAVTYDCWGTLLRDHDWEGAMEIRLGALLRFLDISEDEGRALLEEAWQHHDEAWKQIETFGPGRMAAYCLE